MTKPTNCVEKVNEACKPEHAYRLLRLILKSEQTHAAAPVSQRTTVSLNFREGIACPHPNPLCNAKGTYQQPTMVQLHKTDIIFSEKIISTNLPQKD